jgi:hypothetical protein
MLNKNNTFQIVGVFINFKEEGGAYISVGVGPVVSGDTIAMFLDFIPKPIAVGNMVEFNIARIEELLALPEAQTEEGVLALAAADFKRLNELKMKYTGE